VTPSFKLIGKPDGYGGNVRFSWGLDPDSPDRPIRGTNFAIAEGDRIQRVTGFLDQISQNTSSSRCGCPAKCSIARARKDIMFSRALSGCGDTQHRLLRSDSRARPGPWRHLTTFLASEPQN
jgi:hypothetical protein